MRPFEDERDKGNPRTIEMDRVGGAYTVIVSYMRRPRRTPKNIECSLVSSHQVGKSQSNPKKQFECMGKSPNQTINDLHNIRTCVYLDDERSSFW